MATSSWFESMRGELGGANARAEVMVSVKLINAMPAAAGHISSASAASGGVSFGKPPGISPTTLTPIAFNPSSTDAAVPAAMAMSGAGARRKYFSKTMMTAKVASATASVTGFVCGSFSTIDAASLKKFSFAILMPRSFGSWSTTITRPMPALKPVSTGSEMKFARKTQAQHAGDQQDRAHQHRERGRRDDGIRTRAADGRATEDRNGRRGAHAQHAGGAEHRVHDHRQERRVEAGLQRDVRDRGVCHRLGDHDGAGGEARHDVRAQRRAVVARKPVQGGDAKHRRMLRRARRAEYGPLVLRLDVEAEVHHVAVLHDVVLAFEAHLARLLRLRLAR
jgi:hypothetical protein